MSEGFWVPRLGSRNISLLFMCTNTDSVVQIKWGRYKYFCNSSHFLSSRLENVQYPYHLYISPSARPSLNGPERPFQCPTCGVRFTRIQNLKQHMLIHSGEGASAFTRAAFQSTRAQFILHRLSAYSWKLEMIWLHSLLASVLHNHKCH